MSAEWQSLTALGLVLLTAAVLVLRLVRANRGGGGCGGCGACGNRPQTRK